MTSSDFSIAFHIGAHKTATTHLQRSLRKSTEQLNVVGVRYYGPDYFRLPGRSIPGLFGLKDTAPQNPAKRSPAEQFDLMRKDANRVVFSEENFIGVLNSPRRFAVKERYPHAAARITALSGALGQPIDVLIGIRRPTSFLNSAYCQQLLGGRVVPLKKYKRINSIRSVNWLDLIRRLRAAQGVRHLTIWSYEDYAGLFPQICGSLVGADHAHLVQPMAKRIHEGLSAQAMDEILLRHNHDETGKLGFAMRKMYPVGGDHPAFDGFDAKEHARGDAAYAKQIGAIAALPGVTFLQPDRG